MKARFLRISAILEYVFAFVYAFVTALFYSVSNNLFWLFLVLGLLSLALGLYTESLINRLQKDNELNKNDRIALLVITIVSVIDCIPLIFNLLAFLDKRELVKKDEVTVEEQPQEEKPKKSNSGFQSDFQKKKEIDKEVAASLPGNASYIEVLVAKNRNGQTGDVGLFFVKKC